MKWVIQLLLASIAGVAAWIAAGIALNPDPHPPLRIVSPSLTSLAPREIRFRSGDLRLAGMLFLPEAGTRSVAVIIHGSGASDRQSPWYLALTAFLLDAGHAVLLPDKRGSESSDGNWRNTSFEDLAQDALAAIEAARVEVPGAPVGLIGVSQGGWIAPLAAMRASDLAYVINLSGAAVTPSEQLTFEEVNTLAGLGLPRPLARMLAPLTAWRIRTLVQPELWSRIADFDPGPHWAGLRIPALIVWGAEDEHDNLPVAASVQRIREVDNPLIEVLVILGVGHDLTDGNSGRLSATLVRSLAEFLALAVPVDRGRHD